MLDIEIKRLIAEKKENMKNKAIVKKELGAGEEVILQENIKSL